MINMLKRVVNSVLITLIALVIIFVTSFFYLGSQASFERDFAKAPIGFFVGRTFLGIVIGYLGCLIVLLANMFLERGKEGKGRRILKILLLTFAVSVASSLIGALVFFLL